VYKINHPAELLSQNGRPPASFHKMEIAATAGLGDLFKIFVLEKFSKTIYKPDNPSYNYYGAQLFL